MTALLTLVVLAGSPAELDALVLFARTEAAKHPALNGVPSELTRVAEQLHRYGSAAAPPLVPLLRDDSRAVREFAGYVLRDLPGLTSKELPALEAAFTSGNGWIAPAIAHVGTPEAITFLVRDFQRAPSTRDQRAFALELLGARAALPLVEGLRAAQPRPASYTEGLCELLRTLADSDGVKPCPGSKACQAGTDAVRAALLSSVEAPHAAASNRVSAVGLLGCLKGALSSAAKERIDAAAPSFASAPGAAEVLLGAGTRGSVPRLRARLAAEPALIALAAGFGREGRPLEPDAVALLSHADPEVALAAADALRSIGGREAVPHLLRALDDVRDWRLPCGAAQAIAAIDDDGSRSELARVAKSHWYPPVREFIAALVAGRKPTLPWLRLDALDGSAWQLTRPPALVREPAQLSVAELAKWKVAGKVVSYAPGGMHIEGVETVPGAGLRLPDGVLLGTDRGEWGGELAWLGAQRVTLLERNVRSLHQLGPVVVAVTGLAHLSSSTGALYRVVVRDGRAAVSLWRVLPGAPRRGFMLAGNRLLVLSDGGDVVVRPDGSMRLAVAEPGL